MQHSFDFAVTLFSYRIFCFFFLFNPFIIIIPSTAAAAFSTGDIAINCGSHTNSAGFDGREWIADQVQLLHHESSRSSRVSKDDKLFFHADLPILYTTARISSTQFSYTFQVNPGQKFIRFHFYPSSSYHGFENYFLDFFTVEAGSFTLLRNFSASYAAKSLGVSSIVKEFCLNVEEDSQKLRITFTPNQGIDKQRKPYAFVNGIEIISMPTGLYYTPDGDSGVPVVGQKNRFYYIDNSTALELVQRLNIGGSFIPPGEDFGMFRGWNEDSNYLVNSKLKPVNHLVRGIKFTSIPAFTAPLKIYQTSWEVGKNGGNHHQKLNNFTWKIPVDVGFAYLLRLHFCDFEESEITEDGGGVRKFSVLVNNQIVDVIRLISNGVPIYSDYLVILKGHREAGKFDLLLGLQFSNELEIRVFHGLEIFKLSNSDNNLASPNNMYLKEVEKSWMGKIKNSLLVLGRKNAIATGVTILIILLNVIVFKLRQLWAKICYEEKQIGAATSEQQQHHRFSLDEIISATHNFSDELLIGSGGFGNVYKGSMPGASEEVAIKRLKSNSKQGAHEFWTEIEALSRIRHVHLVSLIGYCNDYDELILVYEYMPRGTLAENLYRSGKNGKDVTPLTWEQRLGICIGAARGLDYLHTGVKYGVIHCDVKDSNILLDQNLGAKVSDFGLSKLGQVSESLSTVSTKVKGTWGYLDPNYLITHKLTRKTDVYAFGVVLLVVLCGKPAVNRRVTAGGDKTLVSSFRKCTSKAEIEDIIDPSLQGKIPPEILSKFLSCIESCLDNKPKKRPTMAQVVASLECIQEGPKIGVDASSISFSGNAQVVDVENSRSAHIDQSMVSPILEEGDSVKSLIQDSFFSSIGETINNNAKNLQLSQLDQYVVSTILEENLTFISPTKEVKSSEAVFQSRERDQTFIQKAKPLWGWRPWEALRNRGKPVVKNDTINISNGQNISIGDILVATNDLSKNHIILDDELMVVYTGNLMTMKVAIYMFKLQVFGKQMKRIEDEIEKLSDIQHENLATCIGYCYHRSRIYIVYELTDNGTLHSILYDDDSRYVPLSWNQRLQIVIGVAQGLHYLHSGSTGKGMLIHGDLKPQNILLASNKNNNNITPQISNSCLYEVNSKGYYDKGSTKISSYWTEYYAPEVLRDLKLTEKSDVYSIGLVLLEVLCCRRPMIRDGYSPDLKQYVGRSVKNKTVHEIIDAKLMKRKQIAERCLAEYLEIAFSCLVDEPRKRPSMIQVYNRLKFALYLQENSDSINGNGNGKFGDENERATAEAAKNDLVYQEILKLASVKPSPSSSCQNLYEEDMSKYCDEITVVFSR